MARALLHAAQGGETRGPARRLGSMGSGRSQSKVGRCAATAVPGILLKAPTIKAPPAKERNFHPGGFTTPFYTSASTAHRNIPAQSAEAQASAYRDSPAPGSASRLSATAISVGRSDTAVW